MGLMGWTLTHAVGRVVERMSYEDVADVLSSLGEDVTAWTFAMTRSRSTSAGSQTAGPGQMGDEPVKQVWQELREATGERPGHRGQ